MFNCTILDGITRIRNGYHSRLHMVELVYSKFMCNLLEILKNEGYINDYEVYEENKKKTIGVTLKYVKNKPALKLIKGISKPGQRIYTSYDKIPVVINRLGIIILSTNIGVISCQDAKKKKVGGEMILQVF